MEMSGEQWVPLARDEVWKALNEADVLKACIPGCEGVDKQSDTAFTATVNAKVGPVKSRFKGDVTLSDMDPPNSYRLNFKGQGAAGFTKGYADIKLVEEGEGTRIVYAANATVGGKLAQVGARLIDGAAHKMANEFFSNLTERLGGSTEQASEQTSKRPESAAKPQEQAANGETTPNAGEQQSVPESPSSPSIEPSSSASSTQPGAASQQMGPAQAPGPSQPAGTNRTLLWIVIAIVILVILWLILR